MLVWCFQDGFAQTHRVRLLASVDGGVPEARLSVEMAAKHKCELMALVEERSESGAVAYFSDFDGPATVGGRPVQVRRWERPILVRWLKVEPVMMHAEKGHDPTVPGFLWYTNAYVPGSPKQAQGWIGFDTIAYVDNPLPAFDDAWRIAADAHPTDTRYDHYAGLGVMRTSVQVCVDGQWVKTPGKESTDYLGIREDVFRLAIRRDDSYLGYLMSYFNVPGVFGSHPHQVDRYIGADCADVIVGAWRKFAGQDFEYTSANGLIESLRPVGKLQYLLNDGKVYQDAECSIVSAQPFTPGLIAAFDYGALSPGWYEHVGVLFKDNGNGIIDGEDLFLQCGPMELTVSKLLTQGGAREAPTRLRLCDWKERPANQ